MENIALAARVAGQVPDILHLGFIDEAPTPIFAGLEGLNDRVLGQMEVFGAVFVDGTVATSHVSTLEAKAKVDPFGPDLKAVFTTLGRWGYFANRVCMDASQWLLPGSIFQSTHDFLNSRGLSGLRMRLD